MHYARQCGPYNKWCDHNAAAAIRKPHRLTGSHTQVHSEDFLSYIYVSRCNRPSRFGGTNHFFWKQIKKGKSTNRASGAILNPYIMSIFTEQKWVGAIGVGLIMFVICLCVCVFPSNSIGVSRTGVPGARPPV